eukprot:CAMPEP_0201929056 /NCGR_PEP_ID=MMETSP0903-20130614/22257_1 /ASSEMBLY_ACC=CAM_ASM_000552 /TAXON_ID=420261 /ORGANISM="Thalassiosira antarctica, Strain CCMP982" /LENGTH=56 /DNA_ID=CAMNT_0048467729 /DNA_START=1 /DNA_END=168 /DNA_ORIENTATION=-
MRFDKFSAHQAKSEEALASNTPAASSDDNVGPLEEDPGTPKLLTRFDKFSAHQDKS